MLSRLLDRIESPRKVGVFDLLVAGLVGLFALLSFLGRLQGTYPTVFLGGDAANIAVFAAARDRPELFAGDAVLADPENFRFYSTLHIPVIQALAHALGGYSLAFTWLLGPHIFLQGVGFYVLGRVLLGSRYWAALFALVTLMPVSMNLGEYWGIHSDAEPRFSFQALLPWLLAAALAWGRRPASWPWLLAAAGALMYVHPVSAPTWALAIWLGLWARQPPGWPASRRLAALAGVGLVFLVVVAPFLANYLGSHAHGPAEDYEALFGKVVAVFDAGYYDVPGALASFLAITAREGILPLSLLGAVVVWRLRRGERESLAVVGLWLLGIGIAAAAIPALEHAVARALKMLPVEIDLVRGIRYTVPLMLLFCVWPLAELGSRAATPRVRLATAGLGAGLAALWCLAHPPNLGWSYRALACLAHGRAVCNFEDGYLTEVNHALYLADANRVLSVIRERTRPGARVLVGVSDPGRTGYALAVRYAALRPMVFHEKDRNAFAYANPAALPGWHAVNDRLAAIRQETDRGARLRELAGLSRELGADYLVVDFELGPGAPGSLGLERVDENAHFSVFALGRPS